VKFTGSLTIGAPAGIVTDGWPANISAAPEPGAIAESVVRGAMRAAAILNGFVPNSFVKTTLNLEPPRLVWTISRSV
jgi:hypothetical protein